jgi:nucleotide-binding universal stress UspA family protein
MASTEHGILVGYDGSSSAQIALRWAAREARDRGVALTVCLAWMPGSAGPSAGMGQEDLARQSAGWILAGASDMAGAETVRQLLAEGPAAAVLCEFSAGADMLVVGCRGFGGLSGQLLGSVSLQAAAHASGPVVVVRGRWRPAGGYVPGHVVAGVDGSAAAEETLNFAGNEAALRRVPLTAVCALADAPGDLGSARSIEEDFERSVIAWEKDHPEVTVHRHVTVASARSALLAAADDAQLLVVGCRGRGGLPGMALGSVSQALLSHAPCPIAIVHPQP